MVNDSGIGRFYNYVGFHYLGYFLGKRNLDESGKMGLDNYKLKI